MTTLALTFKATAQAAMKIESFERKIGRFAMTTAESPQKALCVCREPLTGKAGRVIYSRAISATSNLTSFTLFCVVPYLGPTGEIESHNYCQDFTITHQVTDIVAGIAPGGAPGRPRRERSPGATRRLDRRPAPPRERSSLPRARRRAKRQAACASRRAATARRPSRPSDRRACSPA